MRLMRGLQGLPALSGEAVTIGNFDGVHRGHQHVFRQLAKAAQARDLRTTAVVFEPQPQEYFRPGTVARLTTLREKVTALAAEPVDQILCLRFDAQLAAMDARSFIDRVLVERLGTRYLVVGDDFRFGNAREGDFKQLSVAGSRCGFEVEAAPTLTLEGARVSSTRVRQLLAEGRMAEAAVLLGRPYSMTGRVRLGDQRGRTLGAPTANIALDNRLLPVSGVFAARVRGPGGLVAPAVANAGTRPTVDGGHASLEVHLLDFGGDLYGQRLAVDLLQQLRLERRFASLQELKQQISLDIAAARAWLETYPWQSGAKT